MSTIDDLTSDLPAHEAEQLRGALRDIATLTEAPAPPASAEVLNLIHGGLRRRVARRRAFVVGTVSALALGGTSVAAAQNALPEPAQEAIADFADDHLPVSVPHPEKPAVVTPPVDAPNDAPGRTRPKEAKASKAPKPLNTTAPGQIQKGTKPDTAIPGPAKPADPGSHGRARAADHQRDKADKHAKRVKAARAAKADRAERGRNQH